MGLNSSVRIMKSFILATYFERRLCVVRVARARDYLPVIYPCKAASSYHPADISSPLISTFLQSVVLSLFAPPSGLHFHASNMPTLNQRGAVLSA